MRRHQLVVAGVSVALLLGAATPALAVHGKGKGNANGHANKPENTKPEKTKPTPPPTKGQKTGASGGGSVDTGTFSIQARSHPKANQARSNPKAKGHFNYTSNDGLQKVRCRGFDTYASDPQTTPRSATMTFKNCRVTGLPDGQSVAVTVVDGGKPSATPPTADKITFTVGAIVVDDFLTGGNITIR